MKSPEGPTGVELLYEKSPKIGVPQEGPGHSWSDEVTITFLPVATGTASSTEVLTGADA